MAKKKRPDRGAAEASRHGIARSPKWRAVEKKFLKENPICVACGKVTKSGLQVHHIFPYHYAIALGRPDLELDPRNLTVLCEDEKGKKSEDHHLLLGHLDNFKSSNLDVVTDARKVFHGMDEKEIQTSPAWLSLLPTRMKALDHMTAAEKKALRAQMDREMPRAKTT